MFNILVALIIGSLSMGIHKIQEGHVGVVYSRGVLSKSLLEPGYNFVFPFLNKIEEVQVTV